MRELISDPFYELIEKEYSRCVIDYCLVKSDFPYRGIRSHREAVLFAMLKMIERYLIDTRAAEERWTNEVRDDFFPWSLDFGKAQAHPISSEEFLFVPTVVRKIKGGSVIYDRPDPDVDAGDPALCVLMKWPSWTAANVATAQAGIATMAISRNVSAKGTRKITTPATLLAVVWGRNRRFSMTNPLMTFTTFTMTIRAIHIHNHIGMVIAGSIFTRQTTTRTRSAMLSSLAPSSLSVPVLLAIKPSAMSVAPATA